MPLRRRRGARKTTAPRRNYRKAGRKVRVPRNRLFQTSQVAHIKETIGAGNLNGNAPYNFNFSLNQFPRAMALAPNFRWYKAKYVEWIIEPLFNTFTDDGTPQSIPYLYMIMNRTQDYDGSSLLDLQGMGAKPQKLTTRKVISYVPNWCSPGMLTYQLSAQSSVQQLYQNGLKPQYSYLASPRGNPGGGAAVLLDPIQTATNPLVPDSLDVITNQVVYNGHKIFLDQVLGGDIPVARITCNVTWEFKDPAFINPTQAIDVLPKVA